MSHRLPLQRLALLSLITGVMWCTACAGPDQDDPDDMSGSPDLSIKEDMATDQGVSPDLSEPDVSADLVTAEDLGVMDMADMTDLPDMDDAPDLMDMADMADLSPDLQPLRAAINQDIARNNASAASVAIWYRGQIIWVGGFGQTEEGRVPDEETMFMIGSDTKKIASLAYLQQVERATATRDTSIHDVLPTLSLQYAMNFSDATAHELMSHQGGLSDHTGQFGTMTTDEVLRTYTERTLTNVAYELAPPGLFYNYSNPNFSLLGLMTEQLTGRFWADVVHDDVFTPLDMTRSVARKSEVDENHATGVGRATPTSMTIAPVSLEDTWEDAFVRPAGLVWSTPTDQMKLAKFLVQGDAQILRDDLRAEISSPQTPTYPDLPGSYGYGLSIGDGFQLGATYYAVPVWSHGGNTTTHTSTFYILPQQEFAISILSNGLGDDFTYSVITAIQTIVELPAPGVRPEPVFDASGIDRLTGDYRDPFNVGRVKLTRQGDTMRISMPDLEAANVPYDPNLTPISTRVWVANIQNTELVLQFFDGPARTMYMVNRAFVAKRTSGIIIGLERPHTCSAERLDAMLRHARYFTPSDMLTRPW